MSINLPAYYVLKVVQPVNSYGQSNDTKDVQQKGQGQSMPGKLNWQAYADLMGEEEKQAKQIKKDKGNKKSGSCRGAPVGPKVSV